MEQKQDGTQRQEMSKTIPEVRDKYGMIYASKDIKETALVTKGNEK